MKKYLTMIAAAALTAACSSDLEKTDGTLTPNNAITFDVALENVGETRAIGEISEDATVTPGTTTFKELTFENHPLGTTDLRGFGVFGSFTGKLAYENTSVKPDFMWNQQVVFDATANRWNYTPVKYWPNEDGDHISFFAYAPYEPEPKDDGRCVIAISDTHNYGDPWLNYRISADPWNLDNDPQTEPQVDLMFGINADTDMPWLNQQHFNVDGTNGTAGNINATTKFTFKHALACIGDKIEIRMSPELNTKLENYADITITKVTINYENITTKARLVLNCNGSANWKEIISGELTTTRTYVKDLTVAPAAPIVFAKDGALANEDYKLISEGDGFFYIPLQVKGTEAAYAEIALDYTVDNGVSQYNGTATGKFLLDMNLEGKKQGIHLTLTKDLSLEHLVLPLTEPATEPSYSRLTK